MSIIQVSKISGFPENLPQEQIVEDDFKEKIKKNFLLSGFNSIETSLVERKEVLLSKGAVDNEVYGLKRLSTDGESEKDLGIRFDLTVPLARYVAQNNDKLVFPFKRFQIQKVYRGERAQKGRYREFYQADIDIIGNEELPILADSEIISTIYNTLYDLDIGKFTINLNNRKFLIGFLLCLGISENDLQDIILIIDKKDKIDEDKINLPNTKKELFEKLKNGEFKSDEKVEEIIEFINLGLDGDLEKIEKFIQKYLTGSENKNKLMLKEGFRELKEIYNSSIFLGVGENYIKINPSISRGLNYYTGTVYETFIDNYENLGSISSGGRYDNLTGNFIKNKYPGVGGSIGLSRLLSIISDVKPDLFDKKTKTDVLVLYLDDDLLSKYFSVINDLRNSGINTEFYLENSKISKQIKYAQKKGINYLVILGKDEFDKGLVSLKILDKREQIDLSFDELVKTLKNFKNEKK